MIDVFANDYILKHNNFGDTEIFLSELVIILPIYYKLSGVIKMRTCKG